MQIPGKIPAIIAILSILIFCFPPAAGTLNKISGNVPVFIGESDLDISSGLNGCHVIAWWANGTDINTADPAKNISIVPINTASSAIYHFNINPDVFTGFTGTWYCQDKKPYYPVFQLLEPQVSLKVWDLDHDTDVTGQSIPFATNITYRIDTDMGPAALYKNRPNANPSDSFYTVSMADPHGVPVSLLYTGTAGNPETVILPFDTHPFITQSPYYGINLPVWSHTARDKQGYFVYPDGTYTLTVRANLNKMQDAYANSKLSGTGKITDTVTVTLVKEVTATPVITRTPEATITPPPGTLTPETPVATATPVAKKTTYSPVPAGIVMAGITIAGLLVVLRRR